MASIIDPSRGGLLSLQEGLAFAQRSSQFNKELEERQRQFDISSERADRYADMNERNTALNEQKFKHQEALDLAREDRESTIHGWAKVDRQSMLDEEKQRKGREVRFNEFLATLDATKYGAMLEEGGNLEDAPEDVRSIYQATLDYISNPDISPEERERAKQESFRHVMEMSNAHQAREYGTRIINRFRSGGFTFVDREGNRTEASEETQAAIRDVIGRLEMGQLSYQEAKAQIDPMLQEVTEYNKSERRIKAAIDSLDDVARGLSALPRGLVEAAFAAEKGFLMTTEGIKDGYDTAQSMLKDIISLVGIGGDLSKEAPDAMQLAQEMAAAGIEPGSEEARDYAIQRTQGGGIDWDESDPEIAAQIRPGLGEADAAMTGKNVDANLELLGIDAGGAPGTPAPDIPAPDERTAETVSQMQVTEESERMANEAITAELAETGATNQVSDEDLAAMFTSIAGREPNAEDLKALRDPSMPPTSQGRQVLIGDGGEDESNAYLSGMGAGDVATLAPKDGFRKDKAGAQVREIALNNFELSPLPMPGERADGEGGDWKARFRGLLGKQLGGQSMADVETTRELAGWFLAGGITGEGGVKENLLKRGVDPGTIDAWMPQVTDYLRYTKQYHDRYRFHGSGDGETMPDGWTSMRVVGPKIRDDGGNKVHSTMRQTYGELIQEDVIPGLEKAFQGLEGSRQINSLLSEGSSGDFSLDDFSRWMAETNRFWSMPKGQKEWRSALRAYGQAVNTPVRFAGGRMVVGDASAVEPREPAPTVKKEKPPGRLRTPHYPMRQLADGTVDLAEAMEAHRAQIQPGAIRSANADAEQDRLAAEDRLQRANAKVKVLEERIMRMEADRRSEEARRKYMGNTPQ